MNKTFSMGSAESNVQASDSPKTAVPASEPAWQLVAEDSWLAGQIFTIEPDKRYTIGRSSDCDIAINGSHLSRRHAEIALVGSALRIHDLHSANGTYLNEKPVEDDLAHHGDQLRLDVYRFRIVNPTYEPPKPRPRTTTAGALPQVDRKPVPSAHKRWKTKPTSPGNRIEPTTASNTPTALWLVLGLCLVAAVVLGALLFA